MARYRRVLAPFVLLAVLFGVFLTLGRRYHQWAMEIRLDTVKPAYYHYEFVDIRLRARDPGAFFGPAGTLSFRAEVLRNGRPVTTIGGLRQVDLLWNPEEGAFIGHWPCPWNAPDGEYRLSLLAPHNIQRRLKSFSFQIVRRKPVALPRRFVALNMESVQPLATMRIRTPDGRVANWKGVLDWVQYVGADAFWLLAGETRGDRRNEIWVPYNLPMIPIVARECKKRGIRFGAYAMCYLTMSKDRLQRYRYAEDIENGKPVFTRAISLADSNRPGDVAALLKNLKSAPGVDYVGLDYIRNALGGYELIDDFFREMTWIPRSGNWDQLSRDERMVWFARKKIARKDRNFIDAWQWWRAHRVALIVHRIHEELGWNVPLWAFALTWEKGWQHGQDPVMMNDAGVDIDALMCYEATAPQFEDMMNAWHSYVRKKDVQLLVGDVIDWPLHQKSPRGPGEYVYRMKRAIQSVYGDGHVEGLFIHDLARGLWGRLGPYSTLDWMNAVKSVVTYFRSLPEDHPLPPPAQQSRR